MPSQTQLAAYDDQYYQQPYTYTGHRYQQHASYPTAAPTAQAAGVALMSSSAEALAAASYGPRQSWSTDSQHAGSEYGSPSGTPYSEYGPSSSSEQEYYSGSASSSVGYPESSQRTHVSGATYPTMYGSRYYPAADSLSNAPSRLPDASEDEEAAAAFHYAESTHHGYSQRHPTSPLPSDTTRRAEQNSWHESSESPPAFDRLPGQIAASYARNDAVSQLASQTSAAYLLGRSPPSALSSHNDSRSECSSRIVARDSPKIASYSYQSRLPGISRLGEPGNPSAVPPLVFDEDYDDESECSLPSATSDAYRSVYPAQYSSSASESGLSYTTSMSMQGRSDGRSMRSSLTPPSDSMVSSSASSERPGQDRPKSSHKKSKMHQCTVCNKWFPRPSGLATHMNSHSGAKPYKCPIPNCPKSFAVRSNAKRHLRTHGIFPTSDHSSTPSQYTVGFDAPIVSEVHEVGKLPAKLRWVPQSLATRTNVDFLRDAPSDSEDEYPPSCPVLSVPLPAIVPSPKWDGEDYEERNSYEDMGPSPYLNSQQWRALPGPAIVTAGSL